MSTQLASKKVDIWNEAVQINQTVYDKEREILSYYDSRLKPDWDEVTPGETCIVYEDWEGQPSRFFLFDLNGITYCGIKLLSPIVTIHKSPGFFCSLIKPEMILGQFIRSQVSQEGVKLFYTELSVKSRLEIFEKLSNDPNVDIYYPYVHLGKAERQEITTPDEGWFITEERAELLSIGERHYRQLSVELVQNDNLSSPVIYDPACSTGKFLSEIKSHVPDATVIGQDLSREMCQYAAPKLDKVIIGNSMDPGVDDGFCDYIFFRFLNTEVVSTKLAQQLFVRIMKCLKEDGKAILFGHTPVLMSKPEMERLGYEVMQSNRYIESENAVCQYYIIKKNP